MHATACNYQVDCAQSDIDALSSLHITLKMHSKLMTITALFNVQLMTMQLCKSTKSA